jgi:hypothetical protein
MSQCFDILSEDRREYRRFNTVGTPLTVRLNPPTDTGTANPLVHFAASINDLFEQVLQGSADGDMVRVATANDVNQNDGAVGISCRRRDQLSADVFWSGFEMVSQSNARFNALDNLNIVVHRVGMPVGFERVKTKGRPVDIMAHMKRIIIEVKAKENCLAHALVIAIAKATNDPNYNSYRRGYKLRLVLDNLLATTGIDLSQGAGIPEIEIFQDHYGEYKIVGYEGLNCDNIKSEGRVESPTRINLLYDDGTIHYYVIGSLTGNMTKQFVCKGCGNGSHSDTQHKCDQTCSDCKANSPCVFARVRTSCADCFRHFRNPSGFENHKKMTREHKKTVCGRLRNCASCDGTIAQGNRKHECG